MYEKALKSAFNLFKVPRSEQQFPYIPFVFGAYSLPTLVFPFSRFSSPYERELQSVYQSFVDLYLSKDTEKMVGFVNNSIILKCQKSLVRLESARVTLKAKPKPGLPFFKVIAERDLEGTSLAYPELSVPPTVKPRLKDQLLDILWKNSDEMLSMVLRQPASYDIPYYELNKFDPAEIVAKKRKNILLTQKEEDMLKKFHQHLVNVGIHTTQVLVASRDTKPLVLTNHRNEEIDGETEPNIHIFCFEKFSTKVGGSDFLHMNFLMDVWILTDVDFWEQEEEMYS